MSPARPPQWPWSAVSAAAATTSTTSAECAAGRTACHGGGRLLGRARRLSEKRLPGRGGRQMPDVPDRHGTRGVLSKPRPLSGSGPCVWKEGSGPRPGPQTRAPTCLTSTSGICEAESGRGEEECTWIRRFAGRATWPSLGCGERHLLDALRPALWEAALHTPTRPGPFLRDQRRGGAPGLHGKARDRGGTHGLGGGSRRLRATAGPARTSPAAEGESVRNRRGQEGTGPTGSGRADSSPLGTRTAWGPAFSAAEQRECQHSGLPHRQGRPPVAGGPPLHTQPQHSPEAGLCAPKRCGWDTC